MIKIINKIIVAVVVSSLMLSSFAFASALKGNVDTNPATISGNNFWKLNGDVEDAGMRDAWFAFSKSNNLSCASNSQREKIDGGAITRGKSFYANVSFLDKNSKYYFKACGIDRGGMSVEGRVLELNTSDGDETNNLDVTTFQDVEHSANSVKLKGQVKGGNNASVWFAIDLNGDSPNCERGNQKKLVYGNFDENDYFYKRVNFLEDETKYSYRACAKNYAGKVFYGDVKSFVTDSRDTSKLASANTLATTNITKTSAQFNGKVFVNGTSNAKVYFAYGKNKDSLNSKTDYLSTENTDLYFQASVRLASNTTYYTQAVVIDRNEDIVFKGDVKSFKTLGAPKVSSSSKASYVKEIVEESTIVQHVRLTSFDDLIYKKTVSADQNKNYGLRASVEQGDFIYSKLRFVNNSTKTIEGFTFTDIIPEGFTLVDLKENIKYENETREISWTIDELKPEESEVVVLKMKVAEDAISRTIVSQTSIDSGNKVATTNSVRITIEEKSGVTSVDRGQGALLISGADEFPSTIFDWLLIVAFVLFVLFIILKLIEMNVRIKKDIQTVEKDEENKMN